MSLEIVLLAFLMALPFVVVNHIEVYNKLKKLREQKKC